MFGFTTGNDGSTMAIDLADPPVRPVRFSDRNGPCAPANIVAPSLAAAVILWLDDFEKGYLSWAPGYAWQDSRY